MEEISLSLTYPDGFPAFLRYVIVCFLNLRIVYINQAESANRRSVLRDARMSIILSRKVFDLEKYLRKIRPAILRGETITLLE